MAENLERKKNLGICFKKVDMKVYQHRVLKRADSEPVLRFAIRCSVVELHGDKYFLLTDRHDKIIFIYRFSTDSENSLRLPLIQKLNFRR